MTCVIIPDDRQLAAIIAGLRLIERELPRGEFLPQGIHEIFDAGETIQPLTESEIDELCDSLAMTEPRFVMAEIFETEILFFGPDGWGDVSTATQFSFDQMLSAHLPIGADPRWVPLTELVRPPYSECFQSRAQIDALGAAALYGPASHLFRQIRNALPKDAA